MQFAAIYLSIKGVQEVAAAEHRGAQFNDLFSNAIFRDIVISLSATIGLYVVASVIHVRGLGLMDNLMLITVCLVGPVAHAHIVRAVHSPCTLVYQRSERIRCESRLLACSIRSH